MKWLISQTNSVWGLKKNGRGVQFYSNIVNFPDDDENGSHKAEFLNEHVFTNLTEDYREAVKKMPTKAFRERDANSTTFRVDRLKEYPNLTIDELLNHDFAVGYDEKTDKYSYWAITGALATNHDGRVNSNIIDFEATRDWMFELGIENIFDEAKQVEVMRAHVPDIVDNKYNIGMESDNAFVEKIEEFNDENYKPLNMNEIQQNYDNSTIPTFYYVVNSNTLNNTAGEVTATAPIKSVSFSRLIDKYWVVGNNDEIHCYNLNTNSWTELFKETGAGGNLPIQINFDNGILLFTTRRAPKFILSFDGEKVDIYDVVNNEINNFYIQGDTQIYSTYSANKMSFYNIKNETLIGSIDVKSNAVYPFRYDVENTHNLYYLDSSNLTQCWWVTSQNITKLAIKNPPTDSSYQSTIPLPTLFGGLCLIRKNSDMTYEYWELNVGGNASEPIFEKTNTFYYRDYKIEFIGGNTQWKITYNIGNNSFTFVIEGNYNSLMPFYSWNVYQKSSINDLLNKNTIAIFNIQLKDNILDVGGTESAQNKITFNNPPKMNFKNINTNITNNYYSFIVPTFKYIYTNPDGSYNYQDFNTLYQLLERSPYIYKITINQINFLNPDEFKFLLADGSWGILPTKNSTFELIEGVYTEGNTEKWKMLFLFKKTINDYDVISSEYSINEPNYEPSITKPFIPNNIAKLHRYPYIRNYVKTTSESKMFVLPQLLNNKWKLKMSYSWGLENEHLLFKILDVDNPTGIYNTDLRYNIWFQDVNTFSLTQTNEPFEQYLIRNRDQLQQRSRYNQQRSNINEAQIGVGLAGNIIKGLGGIATAGIGVALGNPLLIAGGIAGATSSVTDVGQTTINYERQRIDIENDIAQQKAMLQDLHNSPNSLTGNGGDLNMWISKTILNPIYVEEELWPTLKNSCAWYLHLFGSNLSGLPKNINQYLNNKYHFNHIQTKSLFENYKPNIFLNNLIRQINDLSFRDGITIWHYRKKETFQGIKNYNVNNVDTDKAKE